MGAHEKEANQKAALFLTQQVLRHLMCLTQLTQEQEANHENLCSTALQAKMKPIQSYVFNKKVQKEIMWCQKQ